MYSLLQIQQLHPSYYIMYMFALILSFFMGFWIIMKYLHGYPMKSKIRYSITAGLLATKFVITIATLLGIDHVFLIIRIGVLWLPITANLILLISNLFAVLSLNWERIKPHFTITEEEYQQLFEY